VVKTFKTSLLFTRPTAALVSIITGAGVETATATATTMAQRRKPRAAASSSDDDSVDVSFYMEAGGRSNSKFETDLTDPDMDSSSHAGH
jgi:hypothetical protein